ncbi:MAG: protoheme IX farnesyltransferase [Bacteroidetes bacterium]|nr:protoheme IX farnesyltransferase [Bacteroidota bacterium]
MQKFSFPDFFRFIRINVSLSITFTAIIAAWINSGTMILHHWLSVAGIFLLACGASGMNQYQERSLDAKMERTKNRPVATGRYNPQLALILSAFLLLTGFLIIGLGHSFVTLLLGVFSILWYNGFYTWLKKKTAFAVVPGSITGAIPVLMGWSCTGGSIFLFIPLYMAFFIFMWQIPHFWLMMLKYGKEYQKAGFPALQDIFTELQIKRIISAWMVAASVSSILLMVIGNRQSALLIISGILLNMGLLSYAAYQLFLARTISYKPLFISVNLFMLLILFIISIISTLK